MDDAVVQQTITAKLCMRRKRRGPYEAFCRNTKAVVVCGEDEEVFEDTVEPVLSGTVLSGQLSKSRK